MTPILFVIATVAHLVAFDKGVKPGPSNTDVAMFVVAAGIVFYFWITLAIWVF